MTTEQPKITVARNPLRFYCAPNAADPHYASARDMRSFIAYGVLSSYLDPEEIHPKYEVRDRDIRDLREGFLRCLKRTADMLPDVAPGEDVDFSSHGTGCTLYPHGHDPDQEEPKEYLDLEWRFDMRAVDGAVCIVLQWMSESGFEDDFSIWVDSRCFNNRSRLHRLIAEAEAAIRQG